jgi:hypothetical protein
MQEAEPTSPSWVGVAVTGAMLPWSSSTYVVDLRRSETGALFWRAEWVLNITGM